MSHAMKSACRTERRLNRGARKTKPWEKSLNDLGPRMQPHRGHVVVLPHVRDRATEHSIRQAARWGRIASW